MRRWVLALAVIFGIAGLAQAGDKTKRFAEWEEEEAATPAARGAADETEGDLLAHATEVPGQQPVTGAIHAVVYGRLRGDAALYDGMMEGGPYAPHWVYFDGQGHGNFGMTAVGSQFGVMVKHSEYPQFTGQLELDFYAELRKAFLRWRNGNWAVQVGRDWDIFSPRRPGTQNDSLLANAGNPGARHDMVRFDCDIGYGLLVQAALSQPVGNYGVYSGGPNFQGAASYHTHGVDVGLSFVFGSQFDRYGVGSVSDRWHTVSGVCLDYKLELHKLVGFDWPITLEGEFFTGETLAGYNAGCGQDLYWDPMAGHDKSVPTNGWWFQASTPIAEGLDFGMGFGVDDPSEAVQRKKNQRFFMNVVWTPYDRFELGVEIETTTTVWSSWPDDEEQTATGLRATATMKF